MGGGGGTSGKVNYPDYMKDQMYRWMGGVTPYASVTALKDASVSKKIETALTSAGKAFDSDTDFTGTANNTGEFNNYATNFRMNRAFSPNADSLFGLLKAKTDAYETTAGNRLANNITDWKSIVDFTFAEVLSSFKTDTISLDVTENDIKRMKDELADILEGSGFDSILTLYNNKVDSLQTTLDTKHYTFTEQSHTVGIAYELGDAFFNNKKAIVKNRYKADNKEIFYSLALQNLITTYSEHKSNNIKANNISHIESVTGLVKFLMNSRREILESRNLKFIGDKVMAGGMQTFYQEQNDIEINKYRWDMEIFQNGANMLASIGAGTRVPGKPSKTQSAIGGALSGAAIGAQVGGPIGAGIGAVVGGLSGLF